MQETSAKPRLCNRPITLDGAFRKAEGGCDIFDRKPAEETKRHDMSEARIHALKFLKSLIELPQTNILSARQSDDIVESDPKDLPTTLEGARPTGVLNQNASNRFRSRSKKVGAVRKFPATLT
jgi:hypothetical protein